MLVAYLNGFTFAANLSKAMLLEEVVSMLVLYVCVCLFVLVCTIMRECVRVRVACVCISVCGDVYVLASVCVCWQSRA